MWIRIIDEIHNNIFTKTFCIIEETYIIAISFVFCCYSNVQDFVFGLNKKESIGIDVEIIFVSLY